MQIKDPDHDFYREFLRPYYVITEDGQYLFGTIQKGRRPDRVFYMVPPEYKLGKGQRYFDVEMGKGIYEVVLKYVSRMDKIVQHGIHGEDGYEVGLEIITSIENPHSAHMSWMGKLMMFPYRKDVKISCWNYIIPEKLPEEYIQEIKEIWKDYDENEPLSLFDFTEMENDVRRVINLGIDYFGGAFKKPNLTMVWNRAEHYGMISYHAGCTGNRILKGLSGTGKTTLTVGRDIEQDDALVGMPLYEDRKVKDVKIIGLEAASFAKSEGLTEESPEWEGLMKSREGRIVLAMNIDCENVRYVYKEIKGYRVIVPEADGKAGRLKCTSYEESKTTNGRFIFQFSDLNPDWRKKEKYLRAEGLSFRRFDILEPIIRIVNPEMAVALDSGCESVITSAVAGRKAGERVRVYAATDFMAREQAEQAYIKMKVYSDLGLGDDGKLVFFVANTGYVGEHDIDGNLTGNGEKIRVRDSKKLIYLIENRLIKNWIKHPAFGYLIPDPRELEKEHGMERFRERFNLLNYYSEEKIIKFIKRDIEERTSYLNDLFAGQRREREIKEVVNVWRNCHIPSREEIRDFYEIYYE